MKGLLILLLLLLVPAGCTPTPSPIPTPAPQVNEVPGLVLYLQDQRLHLRSAGKDRLLPELGTIVEPSEAVLTPDGRAVLALAREASGAYLRTYTLADAKVATIKLQESPNAIVAWAPDGSYLAFVTEANAVLVLDRQGHAERLTFEGDQVLALTWGPNGRLLITSRQTGGESERLWRWFPGKERELLAADALVQAGLGSWSPDGTTLAYVARRPAGGTNLGTLSEAPNGVLTSADLKLSLPNGASLRTPQWSEDGQRIAVQVITPAADGVDRWSLITASPQGREVATWAAPAYPCYIYGFWWLRGERLLVQIAGPGCGKMIELDGRTGAELVQFDGPLKGLVHLSPDQDWIAVENRERPFSTTFIPLGRPEAPLVLPITDLAGWCCKAVLTE